MSGLGAALPYLHLFPELGDLSGDELLLALLHVLHVIQILWVKQGGAG